MTNYIILFLCLIVILAYFFDITSRYSRIPSVILLMILGVIIRILVENTGLSIPDIKPILPVIGTLGLILIVLEASLDITLEKKKIRIISRSVLAAIILFFLFVAVLSAAMVLLGHNLYESLLNIIPLGIISSAVAISSAGSLDSDQKEFVVYESSISDIIGILVFDFILLNHGSIGSGIVHFIFSGLLTLILAIAVTSLLGMLLNKITYHVNYVIILTAVILAYVLAKLSHLPALFLILVFGLALSNYRLVENSFVKRVVNFEKFRTDLDSFRKIMRELTFLVRSFFFIMFGYYTHVDALLDPSNILLALVITAVIFSFRWAYFVMILRMKVVPLALFAPRGLITILLFLSVPAASRISFINEEVVTLVILLSIIVLIAGNMLYRKKLEIPLPTDPEAIHEEISGQMNFDDPFSSNSEDAVKNP